MVRRCLFRPSTMSVGKASFFSSTKHVWREKLCFFSPKTVWWEKLFLFSENREVAVCLCFAQHPCGNICKLVLFVLFEDHVSDSETTRRWSHGLWPLALNHRGQIGASFWYRLKGGILGGTKRPKQGHLCGNPARDLDSRGKGPDFPGEPASAWLKTGAVAAKRFYRILREGELGRGG